MKKPIAECTVNRYSWVFEQIFLPALALIFFPEWFSASRIAIGSKQQHPQESNSSVHLKYSTQGKFGITSSPADQTVLVNFQPQMMTRQIILCCGRKTEVKR